MIDKEHHNNSDEAWCKLIELTAGQLLNYKNKIITILGTEIYNLLYFFNKHYAICSIFDYISISSKPIYQIT